MDSNVIEYIYLAVKMSIPLLLGTIGEILSQKVGNMNLGVEGMMLMGSFGGFFASFYTGNPLVGMLGAAVLGAFGALIYAFITVTLRANQTVTGLCLTIFGTGFTSFMGNSLASGTYLTLPEGITSFFSELRIPFLSDIPVIGRLLFQYNIFVYIAILLAVLMHIYLNKTTFGLNVRAIGENPGAADAAGINVTAYKYIHILIGGALCGLGGGYLSMVYIPTWTENVVTGQGWIAVALVIFVSWKPLRAIWAAFLFGGLEILGTVMQNPTIQDAIGISISTDLLKMLPFLVTIIVLIITSIKSSKESMGPHSSGINYFREER